MKFSELQETLIFTERKINDINAITSQIESKLHALKAKTNTIDNVIIFKTVKTLMPWGYIESYPTLLRIYKDGRITIEKHKNSLQIQFSVKLDNLFFIAMCSSIVAGITMSLYLSTELVISVSFGIILFLMFVFLGIQFIKYKISDLINSCVYHNYY